ncbi:hypothetical protein Tco_1077219 [Tanacetum coccineum]
MSSHTSCPAKPLDTLAKIISSTLLFPPSCIKAMLAIPHLSQVSSMAEIDSKEAQMKLKAGICFKIPSHNKHTYISIKSSLVHLHSCQSSIGRKPLEFSICDYVLLKVSPWKGVVRFRKKRKLAPRFVRPFKIIEKVGPVAYRLDLSKELNSFHDTFHVLNLKNCLANPTLQVPLDEIRVDAKLNFVEELVEILEREFKKLKHSRIAIVKVRWNSKRGPEFTWECEDQMKLKYPHLFSDVSS